MNTKKMLIIFFSIIVGSNVYAQNKASLKELKGKWVLAILDATGSMYYNVQTDSLYVKGMEAAIVQLEDSIISGQRPELMDGIKEGLKNISFMIDEEGYMYQGSDSSKKMGRYNPENSMLISSNPSDGENKHIQLSLENKMLVMKTKEDDGTAVTIYCIRKP